MGRQNLAQLRRHALTCVNPHARCMRAQAALKRVLSAYAAHNDKLGYCRAMNNIVGLLLAAMNRWEGVGCMLGIVKRS